MTTLNQLILKLSEEFDQIAFDFRSKDYMEITAFYGRSKFVRKVVTYRETIQSIFPLTDMILNDLIEERLRREEKTPPNFKSPDSPAKASAPGRRLCDV